MVPIIITILICATVLTLAFIIAALRVSGKGR